MASVAVEGGQATARKRPPLRLTENCIRVLESRYLKKGPDGKPTEAPEELFDRVARAVAAPERLYGATPDQVEELTDAFYDLITTGQFMPNSPTLMNAGRELGMLSACFVLPVEDSIDGIFTAIKNTAIIQKAGGGTGFAFDSLRPTGDYVKSSGGTTSGPLTFLQVFSKATDAIQQGAFRRGANMGMMYIHHPDILKFIEIKRDLSQLQNYNLSVKLTDEWMEAWRKDPGQPHVVVNHRTGDRFYLPKTLDPRTYQIQDLVRADAPPAASAPRAGSVWTLGEMFDLIVDRAWATGEPGVVFIDRINEANPTPHIGRMEATNPCGEQPLLPYEACNLASINVGYYVEQDASGKPRMNWEAYRRAIRLGTRFLDNVIDANNYQLPEIDKMCKGNRKIGLGIMGFADALYKLGIGYNTEEGLSLGEAVMKFMNDEAHRMSEELAEERGCFPFWEGSTWWKQGRKMRNACSTTVAPTGTISIIAGCSGGMEPLFSLAFFRNVLNGQRLVEVNDYFKAHAKRRGYHSDALIDRLAKEGTLHDIAEVPEEDRKIFVCAHDITPDWHIRMQAAFQKHCDSSISKTTNFPVGATPQDVREIYVKAYELRCKGVTVYRDGCRQNQPMALDNKADAKKKPAEAPKSACCPGTPATSQAPLPAPEAVPAVAPAPVAAQLSPVKLPEIMPCIRVRQMTPFGNMHVKISIEPSTGQEREVFAQLGKGGDVANSDLEAMCRLMSLFLRCNGPMKLAVQQLDGIGSSLTVASKDGRIMSLADGLAKAIEKYLAAKETSGLRGLFLGELDPSSPSLGAAAPARAPGANRTTNAPTDGNGGGNGHSRALTASPTYAGARIEQFKVKCPECSTSLVFEEGCVKCHSCGYSQC